MSCRAFCSVDSVSKLSLASTSVETRPGTCFKISIPKQHEQPIHHCREAGLRVAGNGTGEADGMVHQASVLGHLCRAKDEGRIGRRILGLRIAQSRRCVPVSATTTVYFEGIEEGHGSCEILIVPPSPRTTTENEKLQPPNANESIQLLYPDVLVVHKTSRVMSLERDGPAFSLVLEIPCPPFGRVPP